MASLEELNKTLPAFYTLSNKNLILIAHVRDETVYFYDQLGRTSTVVLLAQPSCYALKKLFLEFMIDLGTTVIDLREDESFDPNYEMSEKSIATITKLLTEYKYDKIITHPKYAKDNDPQNRAIYDLVSQIINKTDTDNHYTYNKIGINGIPELPCGVKKGVLELYCTILAKNHKLDKKVYDNYVNITSNIHGVKKIMHKDLN
jgi:hypothetical protein